MDLHHKESSVALSLLLLVLAVLVGYFVLYPADKKTGAPVSSTTSTQTTSTAPASLSKDVEVTNVIADKKLPTGFPSNIPVEKGNIIESYKAVYKNHNNATQYTVSYTSTAAIGALWDLYADFLREEGYVLDTSASDKKLGTISGTKGENTLSAVVSRRDKVSLVQLNLLYR
jgi:hypothetical protein